MRPQSDAANTIFTIISPAMGTVFPFLASRPFTLHDVVNTSFVSIRGCTREYGMKVRGKN